MVASLVKQDLIDNPTGAPTNTGFFLDANPMRPNGGIEARGFEGLTIPFIGITFYGPTENSCPGPAACDELGTFQTTDTAEQYDFLGGDAPARLSPLAFANSIAAYALWHGNVPNRTIDGTDPTVIYQDTYGDTDYYLITAPRLPLLMLAEQAGIPGPVLAIPDALLRVWIEDKYRRDLSPGEHVRFQLSPIGNPINLVGNMLGAIPVGIDDTVQQAGGPRVLGTADVYRPFGVGGPVYYKTTGDEIETTDSNILTLNSTRNSLEAQDSVLPDPTAPEPPQAGDQQLSENSDLNKNPDPTELGNDDTADTDAPSEGTKPRPLRDLLRGPIKFDPPQRPSAVRQNGDGPLKRVINALTGQRPDPAGETGPGGEEPKPASETPAA